MKKRIFIIGPNGQNDDDNLFQICSTQSHNSLRDIYINDNYKILSEKTNRNSAILRAKKLGSKRPTVI
jgi:hypothetical protein